MIPNDPTMLGNDILQLCERLVEHQAELEKPGAWPEAQLQWLSDAGVLCWTVPVDFGGKAISRSELAFGYETLGAACLTTTFVLTQRNAAIARIGLSENESLKAELLSSLCTAETFATVGISHLTTSRQHLAPAVTACETDDGFVLDGQIPWVTGGRFADHIVTGATLSDGRQVLLVIEGNQSGVNADEPSQLMALNATNTGTISLANVEVPSHRVVSGPIEGVMTQGRSGGPGSLTTSALALGHAAGAINRLRREAERRPELSETADPLIAELTTIRTDMYAGIEGTRDGDSVSAESVRQRSNSLVLRATQAWLAASKGAGFSKGHPAERAVREAMFFLVWSCPQPVLQANLREFARGCSLG